MNRIEAVRAADEIRCGFGGTADPGQFDQHLRAHIKSPARIDDRGRDRIMPAAGAKRRHRALVVAMGVAELVLRQVGVMQAGLGKIGHGATFRSGVTLSMASFSPISRRINRAVIGVPS